MVNFKNTIIIMTSNLGSQYIQSQFEQMNAQNQEDIIADTKIKVMEMLKKTIRPEFLNRIDETIMFLPLNKEEISKVVELQLNAVKKMLEPQGFSLETTRAAIDYLAEVGFDPEFGARPVKRAIQRCVLNDLSRKILADEVSRDKPITIDADSNGLIFKN
jgi:ATP-dependent Clp protease ATP-binding subunit ClpB